MSKLFAKIFVTCLVVCLLGGLLTGCQLTLPIPTEPAPTEPAPTECAHSGGTATCENKAVCEKCGEAYGETVEHSYSAVVTAPTCTEDGYTTYTCGGCGDSYTDDSVTKTGHKDEDADFLCDTCGGELPRPVYLIEDGKYNIIVKYTDGKYYAMTDAFDDTNWCIAAEEVSVNDGVVTGSATVWTITNDGEGTVTLMSSEGTYLIREDGKSNILIGEVAEKWLVAKDETTGTYTLQHTNSDARYLTYNGTGFKAYAAANDARVIELLIIPAIENDNSNECENCVDSEEDQDHNCDTCGKVNVTEHSYSALVTAPTCTEDGYTTYACNCGDTYVDNSVAALGHKDEDGNYLCDTCGAEMPNENVPDLLADGKYYVIVKYTDDKYYAMTGTFDETNGCMAVTEVSVSDGVVTGSATAWIVTNDGTGNVTLMSPEGVYLIREEGKANIKVGETAEKWLVAKDEVNGTYTLRNTNTDSRYLSYNGTGFKAYAEAREDRVIELLILPANEAAPDEGDPDEGAPEDSVIPNGQYYVITKYTDGKCYAMTSTFDITNGCMTVTEVSVSDGVVTGEATAWTITNDGEGNVTLMSPEGVYLIREEGKANIKVGETAEKWLAAKDETSGTYTLQNTNTDSRYLSYNGTGFKAYAAAREDRVIELVLIPAV